MGFEPTVAVTPHGISSAAPSASRSPLRNTLTHFCSWLCVTRAVSAFWQKRRLAKTGHASDFRLRHSGTGFKHWGREVDRPPILYRHHAAERQETWRCRSAAAALQVRRNSRPLSRHRWHTSTPDRHPIFVRIVCSRSRSELPAPESLARCATRAGSPASNPAQPGTGQGKTRLRLRSAARIVRLRSIFLPVHRARESRVVV